MKLSQAIAYSVLTLTSVAMFVVIGPKGSAQPGADLVAPSAWELATGAVTVTTSLQLSAGQTVSAGELTLVLQNDANLVLYRNSYRGSNEVLWDSHTGGHTCSGTCYAVLQGDGNFVVYNNSQALWHSHSAGHPGARLVLSNTPPYLSVRANEQITWAAGQKLNWFTGLDKFGTYGADRPGLPDYMSLFQEGAPWQQALSKVNVLKIYTQAYQAASDADLRTIFAFARKHNIAMAIEFPPIEATGADCKGEGVTGPDLATIVATRIKSLGGVLAYVAMDEPMDFFTFTMTPKKLTTCPFKDVNGLAQNVAKSVQEFRAVFPAVQVGDIETQIVPPALGQWADAYQAAVGMPLAFYHDDALVETSTFKQTIRGVQQTLADRNIPYGLIRNGINEATSDAQWIGTGQGRVQVYAALGVAQPDHNIFQSWNPFPRNALPENSSTSLTSMIDYMYPPIAAEKLDSASFPVYRFFYSRSGDHFYSDSNTEGLRAGYSLDGPAFALFRNGGGSRAVLYRCSDAGYHFLSGSANCEGKAVEGPLGYMESTISTHAPHPIYRCSGAKGHLQTLNALECQASGFSVDGVMGYAP